MGENYQIEVAICQFEGIIKDTANLIAEQTGQFMWNRAYWDRGRLARRLRCHSPLSDRVVRAARSLRAGRPRSQFYGLASGPGGFTVTAGMF